MCIIPGTPCEGSGSKYDICQWQRQKCQGACVGMFLHLAYDVDYICGSEKFVHAPQNGNASPASWFLFIRLQTHHMQPSTPNHFLARPSGYAIILFPCNRIGNVV
ncbi:hypothetical protein SK128_024897 [Halocaridina rubra]|uniref:Uncharacterized protein n=1 Tax=Halocaridina rubra TaxID=373956 RepID=A0AAN8WL86_HALRR